jgi:hypothetical protein
MKNSNDTIGNRTRDLPTCSAVSQPTDLQRAPVLILLTQNLKVNIIKKTTNKLQICSLIYYSLSALHVLGDVFAHYQEHLTVFIESGNIHQCRCRLVS